MGVETHGQRFVRGVGTGCSPGDGQCLPSGIPQDLRAHRSLGAPLAVSVWLLVSPCPGCALVILLCPPAAPRLLHCPLLSLF